jgi:hypothetical protein
MNRKTAEESEVNLGGLFYGIAHLLSVHVTIFRRGSGYKVIPNPESISVKCLHESMGIYPLNRIFRGEFSKINHNG